MDDGKPEKILADENIRLLGVGIPRVLELAKRIRKETGIFNELPLSAEAFYQKIKTDLPEKIELFKSRPEFADFSEEFHHMPAIEVQNVSFSYPGSVEALKDANLTIHKGDFVAIMGENGAGKTTLVKHFNGLLRPKSGKILVDGEDISSKTVAQLARKIGLVFQNPDDQLFEETVEKEISFALRNFGMDDELIEERVNWALNLLDIVEYRKKSPFTLSGGERKRVALASVLAWDPDILVLDEPTIGQDYGQKERLRHFLMQLGTQGKTVIIVTHDVEFVAESQPKIVLMSEGRVQDQGPAKYIMTCPEELFRCSVAQPEITKLFSKLHEHGFPEDVLDVNEAYDLLSKKLVRD
jgi:energy-coupling factor transport system ATP-binding protein